MDVDANRAKDMVSCVRSCVTLFLDVSTKVRLGWTEVGMDGPS